MPSADAEAAPALAPTRPPISYDAVGGRVGERAGADSTQVGKFGRVGERAGADSAQAGKILVVARRLWR